jgi:hypothetical protein
MKMKMVCLSLVMLLSVPLVFAAETSPAVKPATTNQVELLRKILEAQRKNPDKVIHHPDDVVTAQAAPPPRPAPATPPPAKPAPAPAAQTPAVSATPSSSASTYTVPASFPSYEELEEAYLSRKISARRFEEALKLLEKHQKINDERKAAVNKILLQRGIQPPESPEQQKKINDAEGKADELMRLKAQRDKAPTNAPPSTVPLTKRQRLDALLRQVIEGKITDAEYREKREKIIAEPD